MAGVDKSIMSVLRRPRLAQPVIRSGVTRAGTVGIEFEHEGVKGWGRDMEAARASWQQNRAAKRHDVGKSDSWEVPMDHFSPALPQRRPNYRDGSGNVVGKRMTGAVTGVAKPKKIQPTRTAPRKAAGMLPIGTPPIAPSLVGKRDRSYNPEHNRQRRLGIATAATAAGGVALASHGGRSMVRSTRNLRMLADREGHRVSTLTQPGAKVSVPIKYELGNVRRHSHSVTADERAAVRNLAKIPRRMVARPTRREAAEVGSGAGLLAASGAMANHGRSRANREYS